MNTDKDMPEDTTKGRPSGALRRAPRLEKPSLVARTMNRVLPEKSKFLVVIWVLAILAVTMLVGHIQGESSQFYGIAESQLRAISFQYPVEIVDIPVVEGQKVEAKEKLFEVRRYDLDVNRLVLDEQINEIKAENAATRHIVTAEISNLEAERRSRMESLKTRIASLEAQHKLNRNLLESISSKNDTLMQNHSPLVVKIRGLKAEQQQTVKMYQARIDQQKQKLADISGPGNARVAELEKRKHELLRQSEALTVQAPFSGSVGSVMFKKGEQVSAFSSVVTIQGNTTQYIKGYIHEAVLNNVRIGQTVWIKSLAATSETRLVQGEVESLGSRIVEYPERLKRNALVSAWGREAIINANVDNHILQGEKVAILLERPVPVVKKMVAFLGEYLPFASAQALNRLDSDQPLDRTQEADILHDIEISNREYRSQ